MIKYALVGVAGFVAPRHLQAIKGVGGELIAAFDTSDNVGVLDSYFPNCSYFPEFTQFDRYLSKNSIDYLSVCTPNYTHDFYCRYGLKLNTDIICEKPLVLHPGNVSDLEQLELQSEFHSKIWVILQLRLNPKIQQLKETVFGKSGRASIVYQTPRGDWYPYSWKGDVAKSGGLATNIGVHLFDILLHLFGKDYEICHWNGMSDRKVYGEFNIGNYEVEVTLDINKGVEPKRLLMVDGVGYELSGGFKDAHTESYHKINEGMGFTIEDAIPAIQLCAQLRELRLWEKQE